MIPEQFFLNPTSITQKQYEALRMFFVEKKSGKQVAETFGYTYRGFTTMVSNFRLALKNQGSAQFFIQRKKGRKEDNLILQSKELIIALRKKYY